MLNYIRIKNLRSLEDTNDIHISPITVLLGENSSGKSTFLRAFPLLKQSVDSDTRSSILWYGKYVDFGDFDQALNRNKSGKEISFTFGMSVPEPALVAHGALPRNYRRETKFPEVKVVIEVRLASRGKDGLTRTSGLKLSIEDNVIDIVINEQGKISSLIVNKSEYSEHADLFSYSQAIRLLPSITAKQEPSDRLMYNRWRLRTPPDKLRQEIIKILSSYMHGRSSNVSIANVYSQLRIGGNVQMLANLKRASSTLTWRNRTGDMTVESPDFKKVRDLVLLSSIPALIPELDDALSENFRRVSYTEPLRATAERYYRSQDLSVRELDSKGENLAMFVRNLTEREKQNLDNWTRREFGFRFEVKYSGGHVTAGIEYENSGEAFNLADMGFGFSQVMPIIVQIWTLINKPLRPMDEYFPYTYVIEQPELHLHPRLQAKLAETLIKAIMQAKKNNIKINLILETHSEAIVNKIGIMMAKKEIASNDANILIFSKETETSRTCVNFSNFDDAGVLMNWPYGFFDIEV